MATSRNITQNFDDNNKKGDNDDSETIGDNMIMI